MPNTWSFATLLSLISVLGFLNDAQAASVKQTASLQKTILLKNESPSPYLEKVVEVKWSSLDNGKEKLDTAKLIVMDKGTKEQVPVQFETFGDSAIRNLLIQVDVPAKQSKEFVVTYGVRKPIETKTFGRYVPERKEDFAWENDKIAFRMYGKELEKTPSEMGLGMDVWVKRVSRMILNERYKRGEYHIDHGDGMDYYHVGMTMGAGNMAPFVNDSIVASKNYVSYKVLDNGPLRTSFQLFYDEWAVGTKKVKATKTYSLDAGSQLNKITVQYSPYSDSGIPVVAGIVKRQGTDTLNIDTAQGTVAYWEPKHGQDGITGVAVILNNPNVQPFIKNGQILLKTTTDKSHSITYYAGAVWDKAGRITDARQWTEYVKTFKQQLDIPVIVR